MPFNIKVGEFVSVREDLSLTLNPRIHAVIKAQKLPFQTSWNLSKIGKKLADEIAHYGEHRMEIFKEFGEEVEGNAWRVKPENLAAFTARHTELLEVEVTVDVNPFTVSEFEKAEGITGDDLMACHAFIREE